jgi:hypothetical protein
MNDGAETATARLWRDRAEIREQERNEALEQVRLAQERCAMLITENKRLAAEIAHLRAHVPADPRQPEIEMQMEALRIALLEVLAPPERLTPNCSGTAVSTIPREEPRRGWDFERPV